MRPNEHLFSSTIHKQTGFPEQNIRTVRTETIQPDGTRTIETRQIVDGCA